MRVSGLCVCVCVSVYIRLFTRERNALASPSHLVAWMLLFILHRSLILSHDLSLFLLSSSCPASHPPCLSLSLFHCEVLHGLVAGLLSRSLTSSPVVSYASNDVTTLITQCFPELFWSCDEDYISVLWTYDVHRLGTDYAMNLTKYTCILSSGWQHLL